MPRGNKKIVVLIVIIICVGIVFGGKSFFNKTDDDSNFQISGKTKGIPGAPIRITEYIDFQCPACLNGFKYLTKFMNNHPQAVLLRVKYFPLTDVHKHAFISARYAECAARQDQFWPFQDLLFKRQRQWSKLDNAIPLFESIAQKAGLDLEELAVCLQDKNIDQLIEENEEYGSSLGVKSVPTFFVNGKIIVGPKSLELELNRLLKNGLKE